MFVPPDVLNGEETFDTALVFQLLSEGKYRTPVKSLVVSRSTTIRRLFDESSTGCQQSESDPMPTEPEETVLGKPLPPSVADDTPVMLVESLGALTRSETVVNALMQLAGRELVRLGKSFRCILHKESSPSASWYREPKNGTIVYRDWHASKYGTPEVLLLGEVFCALCTGEVKKLKPHETGRWLAKLALRLGYRTPLALEVEALMATATTKIDALSLKKPKTPRPNNIFTSCLYNPKWRLRKEMTGIPRSLRKYGGFSVMKPFSPPCQASVK
ncbi:MAG TPA: hypothetical protein GXX40_02765 [Firmicutes bacterium]|nr:hypothetical protein [Bacillota bacterium]